MPLASWVESLPRIGEFYPEKEIVIYDKKIYYAFGSLFIFWVIIFLDVNSESFRRLSALKEEGRMLVKFITEKEHSPFLQNDCLKPMVGKHITLKPFVPTHFEFYKKYFDAEVRSHYTFFRDFDFENEASDIEDHLIDKWRDHRYGERLIFSCFDTETGEFAGSIEFLREPSEEYGQCAGWSRPEYRGRPHTLETFQMAIGRFFSATGQKDILINTSVDNMACQGYLIKLGARLDHIGFEEGIPKHQVFCLNRPSQVGFGEEKKA